jgi:hypothetical protein
MPKAGAFESNSDLVKKRLGQHPLGDQVPG